MGPPTKAEKDGTHTNLPADKKPASSHSGKDKEEASNLGGDDAEPTEKPKLRNYLRILSCGTILDYILMVAGALASITAGATLPLMIIVFGKLVASFSGYLTPGSSITPGAYTRSVNRNAAIIVYLFIARFVFDYISMFTFRITGIRISAAIRLAYLRALFAKPISVLDKLPAGTVTSRITNSSNTIQLGISQKLGILIQFASLLVSSYVVAFVYSWKMTLVCSSILPFISIVYSITVPIQMKLTKSNEHADEKASSLAGEVFGSIRTVVAFGGETRLGLKYSGWIRESRRRGLRLSPLIGAQFAPVFFSAYASLGLAFWFGVKLYSKREIGDVGTVVIVLFSVMMAVMSLGNIVTPVNAMVKATSSSAEIFATIDAPSPNTAGFKEPEASAYDEIIFEDVNFAYPSRPDVQVLNQLNVRFEAGKITAIVGPSGSGKSTIVGLLERWYDLNLKPGSDQESNERSASEDPTIKVNSGSIKVGNHDIYDLDLKWWRSQIGLVQQEPFLFNDTIFQNVAFSLIGSKWENEDRPKKMSLVKEACREAFADEFIDKLPQGYETKVGESGIKLSGGQRQRIAIARSIIKQPPLLILDEATSSIDVRGERIVQEALDRVSQNRTTIMIAHRLSTIKKADKIVVLSKGSVVQEGTHASLLEDTDGVYHKLVQAQALSMGGDDDDIDGQRDMEDSASSFAPVSQVKSQLSRRDSIPAVGDSEGGMVYHERGLIRSFGRLLYEQRRYWILYVLALIGGIGIGASYPLQAYFFAKVIEVFQYTGKQLVDRGNFWSLMFFVMALWVGFLYLGMGWASHSTSVFVSSTYRQQYFESIISKPIAFFDAEGNSAGTLTSRLATDPSQLQELMGPNSMSVLIAIFNLVGSVAISFAFGWKLTLVALFAALPPTFLAGFYRIRFEVQFEKLNSKVFADSSQFATEAIGAFRTVTSLILEETICGRYATLLAEQQRKAFKKAKLATLIFALSDSIELLVTALVFWYGGHLISSHEYGTVQFFVIYMAIVHGGQAAGVFCSFAPNIAEAKAAANRILSLRSTRSDRQQPTIELEKGDGGVEIEFKDVHFKYPTRDVPIFTGLNMKVERGQFVALVGASGCGKTTFISLLERFYDADKGIICVDGKDISQINVAAYRNLISLVPQEPTLYQGSVRENIVLAVNEGSVSDDDIHQVCRDAEIHDFITSLPEGYATDVGSKGVALSGGQKQRIAIARALIRRPRVLLLDEATSSLDSESEKLVQASFERAAKRRTMIVVAHRLATIQNADVIFVFGGGRILEQGDHKSLLQKRGVYFQMCQAQALDR